MVDLECELLELAALWADHHWTRCERRLAAKVIEADPEAAEHRAKERAAERFVSTRQSEDGLMTIFARAATGDVILGQHQHRLRRLSHDTMVSAAPSGRPPGQTRVGDAGFLGREAHRPDSRPIEVRQPGPGSYLWRSTTGMGLSGERHEQSRAGRPHPRTPRMGGDEGRAVDGPGAPLSRVELRIKHHLS